MDAVDDPGHTGYLTADQVKARDQSLSGTFVGVGAVLDLRTSGTTVVRVLPASPAEKAGLRAGEVIVSVDGIAVAGLTLEQVVAKIRGPVGTNVTLGLQDLDGSQRTLTIVRATLDLPLVSWALAPGTKDAVIRLESFSTGAAKDVIAAITAARAAGAVGIVLDLRGNPGRLRERGDQRRQPVPRVGRGLRVGGPQREARPARGRGRRNCHDDPARRPRGRGHGQRGRDRDRRDPGRRSGNRRGREDVRHRHGGGDVPALRRFGGHDRDRALAHPEGPRDLARRPDARPDRRPAPGRDLPRAGRLRDARRRRDRGQLGCAAPGGAARAGRRRSKRLPAGS